MLGKNPQFVGFYFDELSLKSIIEILNSTEMF